MIPVWAAVNSIDSDQNPSPNNFFVDLLDSKKQFISDREKQTAAAKFRGDFLKDSFKYKTLYFMYNHFTDFYLYCSCSCTENSKHKESKRTLRP